MEKKEDLKYFIKRYQVMRQLTNNLGKVVEKDGKLVCYVDNLKYIINDAIIKCEGFPNKMICLAEKYNLNKPVCYVFNAINFGNKKVSIYGNIPCEIILNDCKAKSLNVVTSGKCVLENMKIIKPKNSLTLVCDDIEINRSRIRNFYSIKGKSLSILIKAQHDLTINFSYVGKLNENTTLKMCSGNRISVNNSKISADTIKCESPIITANGCSEINAKTINLDANELNRIGLYSSNIIIDKIEDNYETEPYTRKLIK